MKLFLASIKSSTMLLVTTALLSSLVVALPQSTSNDVSLNGVSSSLIPRGNVFACFGCGWAFGCNPFQCPPNRSSFPHASPHRGQFTIDTSSAIRSRVADIDSNVRAYARSNADNSIQVNLYLTALFPVRATNIGFVLTVDGSNTPERAERSNPAPYESVPVTIPASEVNAGVQRNQSPLITIRVSYELVGDGEL